MARAARRAGFANVEVLRWGEQRQPTRNLSVCSVPGERIVGMRTNIYVLTSGETSVFVGTEARGLAAIDHVAKDHRVDIAVLPVNGMRLLGRPLVMDAPTALSAARRLGASTFVPIHYSQLPIPRLLKPHSTLADLSVGEQNGTPRIAVIAPSTRTVIRSSTPPRQT